MKKIMTRKHLSLILVLSMFLCLIGSSWALEGEKIQLFNKGSEQEDPFAVMYDSETLFLEQAEPILEEEQRKMEYQENLKDETDISKLTPHAFKDVTSSDSESIYEIRTILKDSIKTYSELEFSDEVIEQLEYIYENTQTDRFIVKYREDSHIAVAEASDEVKRTIPLIETAGRVEFITLSEKVNPAVFATQLRSEGMEREIEYIQPDFLMYYAASEIDVEEETEVPVVLDEAESDSSQEEADEQIAKELDILEELILQEVIVALIDTGVDSEHPMLAEKMIQGWNFVDENEITFDETQPFSESHGTHLAGIIGEYENIKIMPLKVFGAQGAYTSDIIAAIQFAEENGAHIVNMSFGSSSYNPALKDAMESANMLFITAAGNARSDLSESPVYPSSFELDNLISVASLNQDKGFSYYSNYGKESVDIAAVGRNVISALPLGETGKQSGTSQATAKVSGSAGFVLGHNINLDAIELKEQILRAADHFEHLNNKVAYGRSLNVLSAVAAIEQDTVQVISFEDDFDVHGYHPTSDEQWTLFSGKNIIQIAAGYSHTLALASDGTVWSFGNNSNGQLGIGNCEMGEAPSQVIGLSGVVQVSAGEGHSLALKSDGTLWAWGDNEDGQVGNGIPGHHSIPIQVLSDVKQIASAYRHTLAVKANGTVYGWGWNSDNSLGVGSNIVYSYVPIQIPDLENINGVYTSRLTSFAIEHNGTIHGWGYNSLGQLGDRTTEDREYPIVIPGLSNIVDIASSDFGTIAVDSMGDLWGWGAMIGDGSDFLSLIPKRLNLDGVKAVSAGPRFYLVLKQDGTIWSWGVNTDGQLGNGSTSEYSTNVPQPVVGLEGKNIISISADQSGDVFYQSSFAVSADGTAYGWGDNSGGRIIPGGEIRYTVPTPIIGLPISEDPEGEYAQVAMGCNHTLVLKTDGTVWSWGANDCGQLGIGYFSAISSSPAKVVALEDIVQIAAGEKQSYALKSDGSLWAWGGNSYGGVGNGSLIDQNTPVQILSDVKQISALFRYTLVLRTNGTVYEWGHGLGDGSGGGSGGWTTMGSPNVINRTPTQIMGLTDIKWVHASEDASFAVNNNGAVYGWALIDAAILESGGLIEQNPRVIPRISNIVDIASSRPYTIAVDEDGALWTWGADIFWPTKSASIEGVLAVERSRSHYLVLKEDGTVLAWGQNGMGQLGNGTTDWYPNEPQVVAGLQGKNIVSIVAGGLDVYGGGAGASIAITQNGIAYGWGDNVSGRIIPGGETLYTEPTKLPELLEDISMKSMLALNVENNKQYTISISGSDMTDFTDSEIVLTYDPAVLKLEDLCAFTGERETVPGIIENTGITINEVSPGVIKFVIEKNIPLEKKWDGIVNLVSFTALRNAATTIFIDFAE